MEFRPDPPKLPNYPVDKKMLQRYFFGWVGRPIFLNPATALKYKMNIGLRTGDPETEALNHSTAQP